MKPESHVLEFFGVRCEVFTTEHSVGTFLPWRFRVEINGAWHSFIGIRNKCQSRRSATMRARARCKWVSDGTFYQHYSR